VDKPSVLLVDDNEATSTLVKAILGRDFTVDAAGVGAEVMEKVRTTRYVAILINEGFVVLEQLQRERPELMKRVLVLAATLSKSEMERVRHFNVFGVISKPFEVDLLLGAVKECAGGRGPRSSPLLSGGMLLLLADLLRQLPR